MTLLFYKLIIVSEVTYCSHENYPKLVDYCINSLLPNPVVDSQISESISRLHHDINVITKDINKTRILLNEQLISYKKKLYFDTVESILNHFQKARAIVKYGDMHGEFCHKPVLIEGSKEFYALFANFLYEEKKILETKNFLNTCKFYDKENEKLNTLKSLIVKANKFN